MGNWRTDVWIKKNKDDGTEDTDPNHLYNFIGRGKTFKFTPSNDWKTVTAMGSKFIQLQSAGKYAVSGSMVTYLDYNNFYHLIGAFEEYAAEETEIGGKRVYHHSYKKSNLRKIPSFTMIARKLNRKVGGGYDETTKFEKVYFKGIQMDWEQGNPMVKVTYNWAAVYNETDFDDCPEGLDLSGVAEPFTLVPVEWGCLSYSDDGINFTPIATNEKTSMSFTTTLGEIGKCGSRIATDFNEQKTSEVTTSSQVYSRDGHWLRRVYAGGKVDDLDSKGKMGPMAKGLKPIPYMRISSFDTKNVDDSQYRVIVTLQNVMVKSMTQDYGASGAISDNPTITATRVWLDIYTPDVGKDIYTGADVGSTMLSVTSPTDGFAQEDEDEISISGVTEAGAVAQFTLNGGTPITLTLDAEGRFSYPISLTEGANTIVVTSKKGDKGQASVTLTGTFARHPALAITSPTEGQTVTGAFNVEAITDSDDATVAECIFNGGTPIPMTKTGQALSLTLTPTTAGENTVTVIAKRTTAGKTLETSDTVKVTYTP